MGALDMNQLVHEDKKQIGLCKKRNHRRTDKAYKPTIIKRTLIREWCRCCIKARSDSLNVVITQSETGVLRCMYVGRERPLCFFALLAQVVC